jgi:hypothetical protein
MPRIPDTYADVFRKASIPAIENFTRDELAEISVMADRLKAIMDAANKRQQDHLKVIGQG